MAVERDRQLRKSSQPLKRGCGALGIAGLVVLMTLPDWAQNSKRKESHPEPAFRNAERGVSANCPAEIPPKV